MARTWQRWVCLAAFAGFGSVAASAQVAPLPVQPGETLETLQEATRPVTQGIKDGLPDLTEPPPQPAESIGARLSRSVQALPVDEVTTGLTDLPLTDALGAIASLPPLIGTPGRVPGFVEHDGWPVVENEWVVIIPKRESGRIDALAIDIVEQTELLSQDAFLFVVRIRDNSPDAATAEDLLREFGGELVDRNHVYRAAQAGHPTDAPAPHIHPARPDGARLGLIDTDIDETHAMLRNLRLAEADFVTIGGARPQDHGTSVASIIARYTSPQGAQLLAASTFYRTESGATGATSASLVKAMDWLVANQVHVINFSLTGPPNQTLENMVRSAQDQGITIVAAVGNDGPGARPLYPAAYDGVIGVTAVDAAGTPYRWANRGDYVDIAALGVGVEVALPGNRVTLDSGTSFAAPVISAYLAALDKQASSQADLQSVVQPALPEDSTIIGSGIFIPNRN